MAPPPDGIADPTQAAHEAGRRVAAELEGALLRELGAEWARLNKSLFKGAMKPPSLSMHDHDSPLGAWEPARRQLRLSRSLVTRRPWGVVLEVLKHEMAHQYVHEVLEATDETAHGPAFRQVCERLAIDASAAGLPGAPEEEGPRARALRRVQRLLALADSPNPHEAEAALNAAHRLMREHNIAWGATMEAGRYGFVHVGAVKARFSAHEKILAGILAEHFFVQALWALSFDPWTGKRGRVLELCGTPENLAIAEHVHAFVSSTAERLWATHRHRVGGSRLRFLSGVMVGFREQLQQEAAVCEETGLVWQGDADLVDWMGRRHPHLQRGRGPRLRTDETWQKGRDAGRSINVRPAVKERPGGGPKRLTGPADPKGRRGG